MRTTIDLDEALLRETRARAARSGRTLSQVIGEAIHTYLHRPSSRSGPTILPTSPGEPLPGVDLDDSAALLELMEEQA